MVFTAEPDAVRDIFRADPGIALAGEGNRIAKPLLGARSLLLLDGDAHRAERALLNPMFRGERMRAYGDTILRVTDAAIARWPLGRSLPMRPAMQEITLDVILRTVFGARDDDEVRELRRAVMRVLSLGAHGAILLFVDRHGEPNLPRLQRAMGPLSPLALFERRRRAMDEAIGRLIRRRRQDEREGDRGGEAILGRMLAARDETGAPLPDGHLRDELVTMLVAGHETTAIALAWLIGRLARHDDARRAVLDELRRVVGDGPLQPGHANELPLLLATIRESMRLDPVIPLVVRQLASPLRAGPLHLPAGAVAAPNIWSSHRNPETWDDPERFDPRRFLGAPARPHHFFPFGGGTRTCIGMAFAYYEMTLVAARLLQARSFRLAPGYEPRVVRRSITFAPSRDMPVILGERAEGG